MKSSAPKFHIAAFILTLLLGAFLGSKILLTGRRRVKNYLKNLNPLNTIFRFSFIWLFWFVLWKILCNLNDHFSVLSLKYLTQVCLFFLSYFRIWTHPGYRGKITQHALHSLCSVVLLLTVINGCLFSLCSALVRPKPPLSLRLVNRSCLC